MSDERRSIDRLISRDYGPLTGLAIPGLPVWHRFFKRTGGYGIPPYESLNTAFRTQDPKAAENRQLLFAETGLADLPVRILNPCHGSKIAFVRKTDWQSRRQDVLIETDAAFTETPETFFLVSTADCIPAIFTDISMSFGGVVHLGWRNLVNSFAADVVQELEKKYAVSPSSLWVGLGPAIYPCCYLFKDPVQKNDPFWKPFLKDIKDGETAIDLVSALKHQLVTAGIPEGQILESGVCTGCRNDLFFSCYKEGYVSGRFPTLVGLRPV